MQGDRVTSGYARPQPFEELDHTADAAVRVRGATAEEALARLVLALSELFTGGGPLVPSGSFRVLAEPGDRAAMAVDVLRELLFRFESEGHVTWRCTPLRFDPGEGALVECEFGAYDPDAHRDGLVLKAVTLHGARFERRDGEWVAEVVFDV